jgi:hypothetical protein
VSHFSDYRDDVKNTRFADQDIEKLLTGLTPEDRNLAELTAFVEALRSYRTVAPSTTALEQVAAEAAAMVRSAQSAGLSLVPGASGESSDRRKLWLTRRIAVALAAAILMIGTSSVAIAADGANPGDALYGLDRALERIGIGAGNADERILEADALAAAGDTDAAFGLLGVSLEELEARGNAVAVAKVERHLELATTKSDPNAVAAQTKVLALKTFIEAYKGKGDFFDGKDFGQCVAEIARGGDPCVEPTQTPAGAVPDDDTGGGPPENAGPKEGKGNAPENAGPKDR